MNLQLAAKGRGEPLTGIRDQGAYRLELISKHPELAGNGWGTESTLLLKTTLERLNSDRASQLEAKDAARQATAAELTAVSDAKALKYHLGLALQDVYATAIQNGTTLPVPMESFLVPGKASLNRNAAKIASYFQDIQAPLEKLDDVLKPYFGGESAAAKAKEVTVALTSSQAAQEVSLSATPVETLEVYEAKGLVGQLIEKANRLGKLANPQNAVASAAFNKDLLLRSRSKRVKKTPPPA